MRVVAISDTHNKHNKLSLPDGEMIIHCGDVSGQGRTDEVFSFLNWFEKLDYQYKLFIAGNHDFFFEKKLKEEKQAVLKDRGIIYLENEAIEIGGLKFYGSPVSPWFFNWAFNVHRGDAIKEYWDKIPNDTDVLITHGPPMGILDANEYGEKCGCFDLLQAVTEIKPFFHIFGHIHEGYGRKVINGTEFINASVLDEQYRLKNEPMVFDI